jgi:NTE family protein
VDRVGGPRPLPSVAMDGRDDGSRRPRVGPEGALAPLTQLTGRLAPLRDRLRRRGSGPRTAFVLSGGGNLGALQVGMLRALFEHRIVPDVILGCSVGALNGAGVAADPSLAMVGRLQDLWLGLEDGDVLPAGLLPTTVQLARKGVAVHGNGALRKVIEDVLPDGARFEDLQVPFQCVATDVAAAREVWFSTGSVVDPVLASAALPAMLPPVEIGGVRYIDGAVVNDVPVTRAVELGATTIYVLHVGGFDRPRPEPKRPFDMALHAYWIARRARFRRDMADLPDTVEAVLLPTGDAPAGRFNDFSHSAALMSSAYQASDALLRERARPAEPVSDQELSPVRGE